MLCVVPRVPGRGFTIADVYSTGVEFQVRRGDGDLCRRSREGTSRFDAGPRGGNPGGRTSKTVESVSSRCVTQPAGLCVCTRPLHAIEQTPQCKLVQRKVKVAPPRERLAPLLRRRLAVPRPRAPPGPRAPRDVAHLLRAQAGERREPARRVLRRVRHEASLDSRVAQEVARVALCCLLASFFAASQEVCERCCCCQECESCILLEVGGRQVAFLADPVAPAFWQECEFDASVCLLFGV